MKKILLLVAVLMLVAAPVFAQVIELSGGGGGRANGSITLFRSGAAGIEAGDMGFATAAIISPSTNGTITWPGDGSFQIVGPNATVSGELLGVLQFTDDTSNLLSITGGAIGSSTYGTKGWATAITDGCGIVSAGFGGGAGAHFNAGWDDTLTAP